jgi:hypothetical protein
MTFKTLAELKRIPVGTKLRLVQCLVGPVAPERQMRSVLRVQSPSSVRTGPATKSRLARAGGPSTSTRCARSTR